MEDIVVVKITPEIAKTYLSHNIHNRKIYQGLIDSYARDMSNGLWVLNNQGIGFDDKGVLIDGQHRLRAIVQSGTTVKMLVMFNIPNKSNGGYPAQATVDRGKQRSIGDSLTLSFGIQNANLQAAIIRAVIELCLGTRWAISSVSAATTWEARKVYEKEIELVMKNMHSVNRLIYAPSLASFCFAAKPFPDEVILFMEQYFKGTGLNDDDPAFAFRNYMLTRDYKGCGSSAYRMNIKKYALTALMHFVKGTKIKKVALSDNGYNFFKSHQVSSLYAIRKLINPSYNED